MMLDKTVFQNIGRAVDISSKGWIQNTVLVHEVSELKDIVLVIIMNST